MTAIADDFIDDVDRTLNSLGRFYRHNHMHADTIPMVIALNRLDGKCWLERQKVLRKGADTA